MPSGWTSRRQTQEAATVLGQSGPFVPPSPSPQHGPLHPLTACPPPFLPLPPLRPPPCAPPPWSSCCSAWAPSPPHCLPPSFSPPPPPQASTLYSSNLVKLLLSMGPFTGHKGQFYIDDKDEAGERGQGGVIGWGGDSAREGVPHSIHSRTMWGAGRGGSRQGGGRPLRMHKAGCLRYMLIRESAC